VSGALARLLADALQGGRASIADPEGRVWRSAELLALARRVVDALAAHGLRAGEPVHVTLANRPADFGALLGVWQAGAVAVPVHASAPAAVARRLQGTTGARLVLEGEQIEALGAASSHPDVPDDAALVVATSGTTGAPKAVVLGHTRFAGKLAVLGRLLDLRADDVVVSPLQLTFIYGLWVGLLGLLAGARLVLVPRFSPEVAARALRDGGTVLAVVPTMLRTLRTRPAPAAPALRTILSGGELLPPTLAETVRQTFPQAALFDLYGLTETGSCDFCLKPADQPQGFGSIGHPTERVDFRLIAENGAPARRGEAGELQIRTPFAMLGYLGARELTEAAFRDGYFATGDLARLRADGRLEIVGRIKEIIVRGGNKIAPAEIEDLFCRHPDVLAALCTGVADERLGQSVHVMLMPRPGAEPTVDALRAWAAARIERYKLPDAIHFADALPLGPTGKADRAALARMLTA